MPTSPSYWISAISSDKNIIIYSNQMSKLHPGETKNLTIQLTSSLPSENRKPFSKTIKLSFITANGEYSNHEIMAHFKTPKIEIKQAKYVSKDKSLIVDIINNGEEAIQDLDITLGNDIQKISSLSPLETITKSFIVAQAPKVVNIIVYKPFYEWDLQADVTVESMLFYYIALLFLIVLLIVAIYYYRHYRNALVLDLSQNPHNLLEYSYTQLSAVKKKLCKINSFDTIISQTNISQAIYKKALLFAKSNPSKQLELIAKRLEAKVTDNLNQRTLHFAADFPLSIDSLIVLFVQGVELADIKQEIKQAQILKGKIVLVIVNSESMTELKNRFTQDKHNLYVGLLPSDITKLLLGQNPQQILAQIISAQIALTQISPYQVGGGVNHENMFFGREKIISHIINKGVSNYIITAGRQVGKSSLLKAIDRRYSEIEEVECHYISASTRSLIEGIKLVLHQGNSTNQELAVYINNSPKRYLFLIDEVDGFIRYEKQHDYSNLNFMRSLREKNNASFILAGFWELYLYTYFNYESPIKIFGSQFELEELEWHACVDLATIPMASLGLRYESKEIVDKMITQLGQRANLIQISCEYLIENIAQTQKVISAKDISNALKNKKLLENIQDWGNLSNDSKEQWIDRLLVYSTIEADGFNDAFLQHFIKQHKLNINSNELDKSLARLRISYIIKKEGNLYNYRVPIFREWILYNDVKARLQVEITHVEF